MIKYNIENYNYTIFYKSMCNRYLITKRYRIGNKERPYIIIRERLSFFYETCGIKLIFRK
jgi:hypothetical protein